MAAYHEISVHPREGGDPGFSLTASAGRSADYLSQPAVAQTWVPASAGMHGVGHGAVTDVVNVLTVFRVVRAESREAAARLFEGHPHCTIYPCDAGEVMPL